MTQTDAVDNVAVSAEAAAAYPGVSVLATKAVVGDRDRAASAADAGWTELYQRWHDTDEAELLEHPHVRAYRELGRSLGMDPDRNPPSVQALVNRGLRGKAPRSWPVINPVVDIVNVVAVRRLASLGVFDADRLTGRVTLALTEGGEPFLALGAKKETTLAAGELVLRDDARVLSLFSRRDGVHQSIRPDTRRVLLLGCVVPGVSTEDIVGALGEARELLAEAG